MNLNESGILVFAPDATITETLDAMVSANVGSALCVSEGEVLGIVTERDVLKNWKKLSTAGFGKQAISKIMTSPVTCLLSTELHNAVTIMLDKKIRHLPILGTGKKLVGIMSVRDVLANYHLFSEPRPVAKTLNPIAPGVNPKKPLMNVLSPTLGLESILQELFGRQIAFKVWQNTQDFLSSKEFAAMGNSSLFVDLDGVPKEVWEAMLRTLLSNLPQKHPQLFVFLSLAGHAETEVEALKAVSKKVNWHVYPRPISVAALVRDIAALRLIPAV